MIISMRIWLTPSIRKRYQADDYLSLQIISRDLFTRNGTRSDREIVNYRFIYRPLWFVMTLGFNQQLVSRFKIFHQFKNNLLKFSVWELRDFRINSLTVLRVTSSL